MQSYEQQAERPETRQKSPAHFHALLQPGAAPPQAALYLCQQMWSRCALEYIQHNISKQNQHFQANMLIPTFCRLNICACN